ncbi:hypothetical protein ASD16_17925 [Cellulomonas sp. Root485]|uniref:hypothetical protein n=1 Tax=Cellulomonas sp. Root485 TaxID=1736546 RepID=UPI0006F91084|nr:hypothetical protein [Cellulomonas sp. Root485]KQY21206.1 hypothetical protein ASD16_17925 [Cellulomonas sp. Root485]
MWNLLAALMALIGTVMQALASLREMHEHDPGIVSATAVESMKREVAWWRPLHRRDHRRIVSALMRESPAEAAAYRRMWRVVWAWALLSAAAGLALIGAALTL